MSYQLEVWNPATQTWWKQTGVGYASENMLIRVWHIFCPAYIQRHPTLENEPRIAQYGRKDILNHAK